jgi:hypothetical protein
MRWIIRIHPVVGFFCHLTWPHHRGNELGIFIIVLWSLRLGCCYSRYKGTCALSGIDRFEVCFIERLVNVMLSLSMFLFLALRVCYPRLSSLLLSTAETRLRLFDAKVSNIQKIYMVVCSYH